MNAMPSLFDQPRARSHDPRPAHEAAEKLKPGNAELVTAIRKYVIEYGPSTAFEIADALEGRWAHDSCRSACARARLMQMEGGFSPRGNPCLLYFLPTLEIAPTGDAL